MMPATDQVEPVVRASADVGEGPLWDPRSGLLYWVDVHRGHLHTFDPVTATSETAELGLDLGAVALRSQGGLVLAMRGGVFGSGPSGEGATLLHGIDAGVEGRLLNDCACDRSGRLWVDAVADDPAPGSSSVYRVDPASGLSEVITGATLANGIDWSLDGRTMYFVDSMEYVVWAYDFEPETGEPSRRRALVRNDSVEGLPDGLTVDEQGFIWVAYWGGWCVRRYAPDGTVDRVVELPVAQVSSVGFGGEGLDQLFITTAAYELSPDELEAQPLAGSLFCHRPGVRGLPAPMFTG